MMMQKSDTAHLVDEIDHCTATARHEREHHRLALVSCRQMPLDEDDKRQRESRAREIELGVVMAEHEEDELHREADPEEEVELDKAQEDLVVGEHGLDPAVCAKELVDLPPELGVDLPA